MSHVLDDVQKTWAATLPKFGAQYHDAKLVLFRDATDTGCGTGQTAMGPFYCPLDEKVYIDLGFYDELKTKFGAPGDFAQAYVIAHELGHHVQHLLGTDAQVRRAQQQNPRSGQPVLRRARAPGGLLRGRVGPFGEPAQSARPRRRGRKGSTPRRPWATTGS